MAIEAYLRTAAAELRRAAMALKQDSDDRRKRISDVESSAHHDILNLQQKIMEKQMILSRRRDSPERITWAKEIQQMHQQINDIQRQIQQEKDSKSGEIRDLEGKMNDLTSKASQLESY